MSADGVESPLIVFDKAPAGPVKDDTAFVVVEEPAVLNSDMACHILIVGGVHTGVDTLVKVAELKVFDMDVTAVDPQTDTLCGDTDTGLLQSGKVDADIFVFLIVEKCSGGIFHDLSVCDTL